jgi:hypothetical protein
MDIYMLFFAFDSLKVARDLKGIWQTIEVENLQVFYKFYQIL